MTLQKITQLKRNNLVNSKEIDYIFETYKKYFGVYPNGKKTCRSCVQNSLNQLYKHLLLKDLLT